MPLFNPPTGGGGSSAPPQILVAKTQPASPIQPSIWIPQKNDFSPERFELWQVFVPDATPGIPLTKLFAWYSAPMINDLSNGAAIAQWNDVSGNNRHLTQSVAGRRPIYTTAVQNGQTVARFTNTSSQSLSRTSGVTQTQPFEFFLVCRVRTDANASKTNLLSTGGSNGFRWAAAAGGGSRAMELELGNFVIGSNTVAPLSWNVWHCVVNTTTSRIFVTSADTPASAQGNAGASSLTAITVGVGSGTTGDIDIGEIIITNQLLTSQEGAAVRSYLTGLWATP